LTTAWKAKVTRKAPGTKVKHGSKRKVLALDVSLVTTGYLNYRATMFLLFDWAASILKTA
jgi:hypothetical protein